MTRQSTRDWSWPLRIVFVPLGKGSVHEDLQREGAVSGSLGGWSPALVQVRHGVHGKGPELRGGPGGLGEICGAHRTPAGDLPGLPQPSPRLGHHPRHALRDPGGRFHQSRAELPDGSGEGGSSLARRAQGARSGRAGVQWPAGVRLGRRVRRWKRPGVCGPGGAGS